MKLSSQQEQAIMDRVEASGLELTTLRDDLIDHICCVVESQLGKGQAFEVLLDKAIKDIAPNGLLEVQHKTLFLLNAKRIILMKKLMYGTGFVGSVILTLGITFKWLSYPFSNDLLQFGFVTVFLLFFPMLGIDRYKVAISRHITERLKAVLGIAATMTFGLAGVFKIFHWPGATVLLVLGALIFAFGFLPFLFFTMYKKSIA